MTLPAVHPPRRLVLLGASNLTRSLSTVIELAWRRWGAPLEVLAALGHGRSYGMHSSVLGRALPGILQSGLWEALARRPGVPTAALLADIGNDILYHAPPEQVVDWVGECLDRLAQAGAQTIVTGLPVENLPGLGPLRFAVFRALFVPTCRLSLGDAVGRAREVQRRLAELTARRGVPLAALRREWYGLDPIHLRKRSWRAAWAAITSAWDDAPPEHHPAQRLPRLSWWRVGSLAPQRRWWFGFEQRCAQPCARLSDGTTIALY